MSETASAECRLLHKNPDEQITIRAHVTINQ